MPTTPLAVEFGRRLRALRERHGLSQAALAERLGVTTETVSRMERSVRLPTATVLVALAEQLGVSADYLLGLAVEPPGPRAAEKALDRRVERILAGLPNAARRHLVAFLREASAQHRAGRGPRSGPRSR